jgi:molecular chaperone DnaK
VSKIVGIDLGTTNSLVAVVEAGIPYVMADAEGRRLTPSVVHIPAADAAPVVGVAANRVRAVYPAQTVYSVKRFMGRRAGEIADGERNVTYPVEGQSNGPVTIPIHGRHWLPEEISSLVLKKLKADAEAAMGGEVTRAVITVPAYFNDAQRNATKRAGELAGLAVERIINEPTAAALAYGLNRLKESAKIAVYDLGGGTFDLSILEMREGVFQVLSTCGNTLLGGDDLDRRLVEFLAEEIRKAEGPDVLKEAVLLSKVRATAEAAKIALSEAESVDVALPFLSGAFSFQRVLTRAELESLTRDIVQRTREFCVRALSDAKLQAADLDQVILVGGQTRMPLVRKLVGEWFGCAEFEETRGDLRLGTDYHKTKGPVLNTSQNPDEAVALGAAIQAEILSGGFKNLLLLDVTPLSLGLETFGGLMNVIIPRNSTIPVKAGEMFTTVVDQQSSMLVHVLQGERERAKDNWSLGRFTVEFDPAPRGVARVGVQFEIDANGILHVLARDVRTGRQRIVEMKSAVDVDDSEVQKMVEESVEHAFEDMKARLWVEAKLRAQEAVTATRKGLDECRADLTPEYAAQVDEALQAVNGLLAGEDESGTGDPAKLKAATKTLDEVTRDLAEVMMDKAMEAMLRKRGLLT